MARGQSRNESRQNAEASQVEAGKAIGFTGGYLEDWFKAYDRIRMFINDHEGKYGKTFPVRVATDLLFESRDGEGIGEREFRVHCALLSSIGNRPFARVGWKPLAWRASGFLREPPSGVEQYSRGQVERALRYLVGRGLWRCYSYHGQGTAQPGLRYWTNRLSLEELVRSVHATKKRAQSYEEMASKTQEIAASLEGLET